MIGLIENEIERDLTQREAEAEQLEAAAGEFEDRSGDESEDLDEEPDESEDQGMSMGM